MASTQHLGPGKPGTFHTRAVCASGLLWGALGPF